MVAPSNILQSGRLPIHTAVAVLSECIGNWTIKQIYQHIVQNYAYSKDYGVKFREFAIILEFMKLNLPDS